MVNRVTLIGRLGKDPEVRHFDNNSAVANFSVATDESYTDRNGNRVEQTEWHNVAVWRPKLVEVAEKYLTKGKLVYIEGKLRTRSWDDQDGNKRYSTEVVVDAFKMLERKSDAGQAPPAASYSAPATQQVEDVADDLPF